MDILLTVLHAFLTELVREFVYCTYGHLILGDHFLYSYHLKVSTSIDNLKRNFIFITAGAARVKFEGQYSADDLHVEFQCNVITKQNGTI